MDTPQKTLLPGGQYLVVTFQPTGRNRKVEIPVVMTTRCHGQPDLGVVANSFKGG